MKTRILLPAVVLCISTFAHAAPLSRATLTEVVKDVHIVTAATKAQKPARQQQLFESPDVLRTGAESRAEMIAEDRTITRVGSHTLFSFEPEKREIHLQRGSLLFQSPAGKGGGTIRTAAATASVLGTTLIVATTQDGGFKILLIEGTGKVITAAGEVRTLHAGEMTYLLPGGKIGPVRVFQLDQQVAESRLVSGFRKPLPSMEKIGAAIQQQRTRIGRRELARTGLLLGDSPNDAYAVGTREVLLDRQLGRSRKGPLADAGPSRFQVAQTNDANVDRAKLDPARVFISGQPGGPAIATTGPAGTAVFVARNTRLASPVVDLSAAAGRPLFQFLSIDNLRLANSVAFTGLGRTPLSLVAGGTVTNTPGTILRADTSLIELLALGSTFPLGPKPAALVFSDAKPLVLSVFGLVNAGGGVSLLGPATTLTSTGIAAAGDLILRAEGLLQITESLTSNPKFPLPAGAPAGAFASTTPNRRGLEAGGVIDIRGKREVVVERVDLSAESIVLNAGDALRMKTVRVSNKDFDPTRGKVKFSAGTLLDINIARFQALDVSLAARTINLRTVSFAGGSRVVLDSLNGKLASAPNTNQPSKPGFVNFLNNVTYGGLPAQGAVAGRNIIIK